MSFVGIKQKQQRNWLFCSIKIAESSICSMDGTLEKFMGSSWRNRRHYNVCQTALPVNKSFPRPWPFRHATTHALDV